MINNVNKRLFDLSLSIIAIIVLAPVILIIALLIRLSLGRGVFFIQPRPGLNGKLFPLIKFRTMRNCYDDNGDLLPDFQRMTRLGNFLRHTSLDELPELFNVIRGEISIVGPRPLLTKYLDLYTPEQRRRHQVRPGITGWAQINGRNAISWEEKFKLDVWYVDNRSIRLDLYIIAKTLIKLFQAEGINQPGEVTAKEFTGSPQ